MDDNSQAENGGEPSDKFQDQDILEMSRHISK